MSKKIYNLILIGLFFTTTGVLAGSFTPTPADPGASTYTLSDIYNKVSSSTFSYSAHDFVPASTPDGTFVTLADIWNNIPPLRVLIEGDLDTGVLSGGIYTSATNLLDIEPNLLPENIATGTSLFGVVGTCVGPTIPEDGLLAYWSFDGDADDDSGNGYDGTVIGADLTTGVKGLSDSAYLFVFADKDLIAVDSGPVIPYDSYQYSVSVWAKTNTTSPTGYLYVQPSGDGWWQNHGFLFADDQVCLAEYFGVSYSSCLDVNYADDNWHHLVAVRTATTTAKLYFDGEEQTFPSTLGAYTSDLPDRTSLGADDPRQEPAYAYTFQGAIDEVRVYGRVLTPQEVTNIYNLEKP